MFYLKQQQLQVPAPGTNGPAMIPQGNGPSGAPIPGGKRGRDGVPKETAASRKSAAAAAAAGVYVCVCIEIVCCMCNGISHLIVSCQVMFFCRVMRYVRWSCIIIIIIVTIIPISTSTVTTGGPWNAGGATAPPQPSSGKHVKILLYN